MNLVKQILIFVKLLMLELINPYNYLFGVLSGILINLIQSFHILHYKPFIITFLLFVIFQTVNKYRNRYYNLLLKLPKLKKDPVFIIDSNGKIIQSTGKTKILFNKKKIETIEHIFEIKDVRLIFSRIEKLKDSNTTENFEIYSKFLQKWYFVNVKKISDYDVIMMWMFEINARKSLDYSLSSINEFFNYVKNNYNVDKNDKIISKIPMILLQEGYGAVYMATKDSYGILGGYIYKNSDDMFVKSEYIPLHEGKSLLNGNSNIKDKIFHAKKSDTESLKDFYNNNIYNNQLTNFLDIEINQYISYHSDDISIVCFNKDLGLFESDSQFLNTVVDIAHLVTNNI